MRCTSIRLEKTCSKSFKLLLKKGWPPSEHLDSRISMISSFQRWGFLLYLLLP